MLVDRHLVADPEDDLGETSGEGVLLDAEHVREPYARKVRGDRAAGERPTGGAFKGAPYVNGGLFERPAHVELNRAETDLLLTASRADWHQVEPAVFGGLFTGTLADERRRVSGAHYTPEAEIQKIVQPTIVRPWRERIEALTDPDAVLTLLDELSAFRVLDPACGSGNFLYVAYQQLRTLEAELKARIRPG